MLQSLRSSARIAFLALSVTAVWGCKSEEERNDKCESRCVGDYKDDVAKCEQDTIDCLAGCEGPDDYDCTWDCEDLQGQCQLGFILCASDCPCLKDVTSCVRGCQTSEGIDFDCAMGCEEEYTDCAGTNSPYLCATTLCQVQQYSCISSCEELSYSSDEFATCRQGCLDDTVDCLGDCE